MDTAVAPGTQSYPTVAGHRYRMTGILNTPATDDQAAAALTQLGLTQLAYSNTPNAIGWLPAGQAWPTESLPPLSAGQTIFRAEGTWSGTGDMPSGVALSTGGSVVIFQVWDHTADIVPSSLVSAVVTAPTAATNTTMMLVGAGLAMGAAGLFAGLAIWGGNRMAHANPLPLGADGYFVSRLRPGGRLTAWPVKVLNRGDFIHVRGLGGRFKGRTFSIVHSEFYTYVPTGARVMKEADAKENPVSYQSTTNFRGVPIHLSNHDGRFCADYRALDRFAPGKGDVTCGKTPGDAESQAKQAVAAALGQAQKLVYKGQQKAYPSPWD